MVGLYLFSTSEDCCYQNKASMNISVTNNKHHYATNFYFFYDVNIMLILKTLKLIFTFKSEYRNSFEEQNYSSLFADI